MRKHQGFPYTRNSIDGKYHLLLGIFQLGKKLEKDLRISQTITNEILEESRKNLVETRAFYEVSNSVVLIEGIREILQKIGEVIANSIPNQLISIITFKDEQVTHYIGAGEEGSNLIKVEYEELWDGLAGWVLRNKTAALSSKDHPDDRESPAVQKRRRDGNFGDIIVVPMIFHDELLQKSDRAMYEAKASGKNQYMFFSE